MADIVLITDADFNASEGSWDGSPFDPRPAPQWVIDAVTSGRLRPHTRNCTDYAEWDVDTSYGGDVAGPGDMIRRNEDGSLEVWKAWKRGAVGHRGCNHG